MVFKLLGAVFMIACGALYSRFASRAAAEELEENRRVLELFRFVKSEIADYGTPLDCIFAQQGIAHGVDGLFASLSPSLRDEIGEAARLGRGYGKEELRICDKLIARLEIRQKKLSDKLSEVSAVSRVKGLGLSAAVIILLI